jgi:hypothetical protein
MLRHMKRLVTKTVRRIREHNVYVEIALVAFAAAAFAGSLAHG